VQGQLRGEKLTIHINTACGHCGAQLHLDVDSELNYCVQETQDSPLVFVPMVNLRKLEDASIIDAF